MSGMILYNIKRGPSGFAIAKFDADLNLLAAYNTDIDYCSCPAGPRPTCRHRKMLPRMLSKVNTDEFYCYETQTWHQPLASEASVIKAQEPIEPPIESTEAVKPSTPIAPPAPTIRRR